MSEGSWSPPKWMYREKRPEKDDAYFENMTRVIFLAGLNWRMIDRKWLNFRKAFKDFSIDKVAKFNEQDLQRLMSDTGIVRNRAKIEAAIKNAKQFQNIKNEHGSFGHYLESLDKSKNYDFVIKELGKKFYRIGPSSAHIFLYSIGENIKRRPE